MDFDKLHILLVCNLGASTGVMVTKMKEIAEKSEKLKPVDIKIEAHPAGQLREYVEQFDVVLVGPQMKHQFEDLEKICKPYNKPIAVIDRKDYGMVNGGNILKAAILLKLQAAEG
ncbi:PTS sugar transporter subunit IIB [Peribacillus loiseleuriae]|uniref:PTS sugar transporter subunit IIB n=1 Tax=Peribacillus loiseleuriae TaxID=1679170 RepID=UPI00380ED629